MKTPKQCENMADIRAEIDRLDRQVVALLGQRFTYVKAASKFKTSETTVKAPERFNAMLGQRRIWAEEEGLNQVNQLRAFGAGRSKAAPVIEALGYQCE